MVAIDETEWNQYLECAADQRLGTSYPAETDPLCFKYPLARQVPECLSCQYNFGQVSSCILSIS